MKQSVIRTYKIGTPLQYAGIVLSLVVTLSGLAAVFFNESLFQFLFNLNPNLTAELFKNIGISFVLLGSVSISAQAFAMVATEKKAVEAEKQLDETLLLSIGDGVIATDEKGKIILGNQSAEELLGWKTAEVFHKPFFETIKIESEAKEDGQPVYFDFLSMLISGKKITTRDYAYVRKDGTKLPVALTLSPVMMEKKMIGTIMVFRDIFREKEIERMKSDFISIAAHQLRTPLGSMRWSIELLLNGDVGEIAGEARETIKNIYESTRRMTSLVNDLLNVSRIEQGRVEDNPVPTDIAKVVKEAIKELRGEAEEKGIAIQFEIGEREMPGVVVDPEYFHEAMTNLISNAIKYNRPQGKIMVRILKQSQEIEVSVADTGLGIPKRDQERIFSKLFRAGNAVASETEGSGLGLFVVKSYVERWRGRVWFESEEGKGSTFYIALPAKPKQR